MTADDLGAYEPYVARLERELEEARTAEKAAKLLHEQHHRTLTNLDAEAAALRTSLEEARRLVTMYRAEDVKGQLSTLSEAYGELEADLKETTASLEEARQDVFDTRKANEDLEYALAEARQERDAAQEGEKWARDTLASAGFSPLLARIGELEAALREAGVPVPREQEEYEEGEDDGSWI